MAGAGQFGEWVISFLIKNNFSVSFYEPIHERSVKIQSKYSNSIAVNNLKELAEINDIIIVCVPINKNIEVIQKIYYYNPEILVVDISSFKKELFYRLNTDSFRIVSIHPMFGPGATDIVGKNIILIEESDKKFFSIIKNFLEKRGANVTLMSYKEHDTIMLKILSAPRIALLIFWHIIKDIDINLLKKYEGFSFRLFRRVAEGIFYEDKTLTEELIKNAFTQQRKLPISLKKFIDAVSENAGEKISLAKGYFALDSDFQAAYRDLYRMIEDISYLEEPIND